MGSCVCDGVSGGGVCSELHGATAHVGGWTVDFVAAGTVVALSLLVVYGAKEGSLFNIGGWPAAHTVPPGLTRPSFHI